VPAILSFGIYKFNNLTELNQAIFQLQKEGNTSELLSGLIAYRADVLLFAQNVETDEIIKNIIAEWRNYEKATRYQDRGYMRTFYRSVAFFTFMLHVKLNLKSEVI
jgi:hypothetical protein